MQPFQQRFMTDSTQETLFRLLVDALEFTVAARRKREKTRVNYVLAYMCVIVISRVLRRPEKRSRGNQLIRRRLVKQIDK